jgi:hypothetical protein
LIEIEGLEAFQDDLWNTVFYIQVVVESGAVQAIISILE